MIFKKRSFKLAQIMWYWSVYMPQVSHFFINLGFLSSVASRICQEGKTKEKQTNLPDFCPCFLFFQIFPLFPIFFLLFSKVFTVKGALCSPLSHHWLCHWVVPVWKGDGLEYTHYVNIKLLNRPKLNIIYTLLAEIPLSTYTCQLTQLWRNVFLFEAKRKIFYHVSLFLP